MIHPALPHSNGIAVSLKELLSYQKNKPAKASQGMGGRTLAGPYRSLIKGRGMEFDEVRHYQPGDDVRSIDWRVTARTGSTHTKVFKEEKERPVFILVDLSDSMTFGSTLLYKSVQAAHLAALLAWQAKQRNDRVGAVLFNQAEHLELKPKARTTGVLQLLHGLCSLQQQQPSIFQQEDTKLVAHSHEQFTAELTRLRRLAHTGSQIHLISDFASLTEQGEKQLALMQRHNQVSAWQIEDPLEISLPKSAKGQLKIRSFFGESLLNLSQQRQTYADAAQAKRDQLSHRLKRRAISHHTISAGLPLLEQM
ncbi:DUF58 domain-containing protein [Motilimonas pumila]|uniref:DUF58 domain-containing protein n=1 Tax=Motilimonas pumila TaxID=2303987 RepID=A0A418YGG2_9GAMM|nr:DUF58 domain-containing protein [Motilimonas pumila]RJG48678.1 DUF58 domain-containing protein [Motilimonas pumila]